MPETVQTVDLLNNSSHARGHADRRLKYSRLTLLARLEEIITSATRLHTLRLVTCILLPQSVCVEVDQTTWDSADHRLEPTAWERNPRIEWYELLILNLLCLESGAIDTAPALRG